jgi:hypothetical protein
MNQIKQSNQNQNQNHTDIVANVILNGDLSKLSGTQRVEYYNGYCSRLGLDPYTKPFDLLKLNGREILYCTRSGAQQLNKLHNVSHQITSREINEMAGVYVVTARASLPDGRFTESLGAANINGLKGDAWGNAAMKAETKAKRRATLDLLGLGVLDETEIETIPAAKKTDPQPEKFREINVDSMDSIEIKCRTRYDNADQIKPVVELCETMAHLKNLYLQNQSIIDNEPAIKQMLTDRKNQIKNQ